MLRCSTGLLNITFSSCVNTAFNFSLRQRYSPATKQNVVKRGVAQKINVVFNVRMDAQETSLIIDAAGGDTAFARLLGLDQTPGYQQRVNNWKRRGIPAQVVLDHLPSIEFLRRTARQSPERAA